METTRGSASGESLLVHPDLPARIAAIVVDSSVAGDELQQAAELTAVRTEALSHRAAQPTFAPSVHSPAASGTRATI